MSDRDDKGRFLTGNNGGGRPKGARSKLSEGFLDALQADFEQHGVEVIAKVRQQDTTAYLKIIANLMPAKLEAELQAQVDVNLGLGGAESIAEVLEMVTREAGYEAAVTLAGMFGIEHYLTGQTLDVLPSSVRGGYHPPACYSVEGKLHCKCGRGGNGAS